MTERGLAFEQGASFTLLPGSTMGIPFANSHSPGLYFYSLGNYGTMTVPGDVSPNVGFGKGTINVDVPDYIPALLWTTPWMLFGAHYAILVGQPVAQVKAYGEIPGRGYFTSQGGGLRNTIITPINLSWHLPNGWYVGAGFNSHVPIARTTGINGLDSGGQPYWTLEPTLAASYLKNGYDFSATVFYDIYTTNTYSHVTDGQAVYLDLTATKKFGQYEFGPVGYFAAQTTKDTGGNALGYLTSGGAINSCEPEPGGFYNYCVRAAKAGVGGMASYDFDRGNIALLVTQSVLSHGSGGSDGWRVWTQFSFKLYGDGVSPPLHSTFDGLFH
ncbi:MAG TPA: transporter [Methylovirgula sp.]